MDSFFPYDKYVTGRHFIGRTVETKAFANLLAAGENVVIYEPPKTGKMSLVQQSFFNMKSAGQLFEPLQISLLDVRTISELTLRLASCALRSAGSGPADFAAAGKELLGGTHLYFDSRRFEDSGELLSADGQPGPEELRAAILLPYRIGRRTGVRRIVVIEEFQNVMLTEDGDEVCRLFEEVFKTLPDGLKGCAGYVFLGSRVNAMQEIFRTRRWFWRCAERIRLQPIDSREIIEHVVKGFLTTGKVADRELLQGMCLLFRCNIWYINHFSAICDSLTRGYIMEQTFKEALDRIIAVHEPRFISMMNDLTTFQLSLLRAILDGNKRFSGAEIIRRYSLNSSANVRRLKDALCKKEIISFDADENPVIQDPLFDYWVRKYYFKMTA